MIGYFVGVVRSPLTEVLIISEMTGSRAMSLPLTNVNCFSTLALCVSMLASA